MNDRFDESSLGLNIDIKGESISSLPESLLEKFSKLASGTVKSNLDFLDLIDPSYEGVMEQLVEFVELEDLIFLLPTLYKKGFNIEPILKKCEETQKNDDFVPLIGQLDFLLSIGVDLSKIAKNIEFFIKNNLFKEYSDYKEIISLMGTLLKVGVDPAVLEKFLTDYSLGQYKGVYFLKFINYLFAYADKSENDDEIVFHFTQDFSFSLSKDLVKSKVKRLLLPQLNGGYSYSNLLDFVDLLFVLDIELWELLEKVHPKNLYLILHLLLKNKERMIQSGFTMDEKFYELLMKAESYEDSIDHYTLKRAEMSFLDFVDFDLPLKDHPELLASFVSRIENLTQNDKGQLSHIYKIKYFLDLGVPRETLKVFLESIIGDYSLLHDLTKSFQLGTAKELISLLAELTAELGIPSSIFTEKYSQYVITHPYFLLGISQVVSDFFIPLGCSVEDINQFLEKVLKNKNLNSDDRLYFILDNIDFFKASYPEFEQILLDDLFNIIKYSEDLFRNKSGVLPLLLDNSHLLLSLNIISEKELIDLFKKLLTIGNISSSFLKVIVANKDKIDNLASRLNFDLDEIWIQVLKKIREIKVFKFPDFDIFTKNREKLIEIGLTEEEIEDKLSSLLTRPLGLGYIIKLWSLKNDYKIEGVISSVFDIKEFIDQGFSPDILQILIFYHNFSDLGDLDLLAVIKNHKDKLIKALISIPPTENWFDFVEMLLDLNVIDKSDFYNSLLINGLYTHLSVVNSKWKLPVPDWVNQEGLRERITEYDLQEQQAAINLENVDLDFLEPVDFKIVAEFYFYHFALAILGEKYLDRDSFYLLRDKLKRKINQIADQLLSVSLSALSWHRNSANFPAFLPETFGFAPVSTLRLYENYQRSLYLRADWAEIASTTSKLLTLPKDDPEYLVWMDHLIDLQHTNGRIFDRSTTNRDFRLGGKKYQRKELEAFLDKKSKARSVFELIDYAHEDGIISTFEKLKFTRMIKMVMPPEEYELILNS